MSTFRDTLGWRMAAAQQERDRLEAQRQQAASQMLSAAQGVGERQVAERGGARERAIQAGTEGVPIAGQPDDELMGLAELGAKAVQNKRAALVAAATQKRNEQAAREAAAMRLRQEMSETTLEQQAARDAAAKERLQMMIDAGIYDYAQRGSGSSEPPEDKALRTDITALGNQIGQLEATLRAQTNELGKIIIPSARAAKQAEIATTEQRLAHMRMQQAGVIQTLRKRYGYGLSPIPADEIMPQSPIQQAPAQSSTSSGDPFIDKLLEE